MVEIICRELTAAWQPVGLSFNFERRQMQTQVARIMSVTEKTLCLSFEIRMPHSSGLLNLAFPAVVANTILRRLTSDWGRRRRHAGETRARMEAAARRIRFGGSLQLPAVRLAASAIENLEPGIVLRLDLAANTLSEWRVGGQTLSEAQAIRQGPHRAARMERPSPRLSHEELSRLLDQVAAATCFPRPWPESRSWSSRCPRPWWRALSALPPPLRRCGRPLRRVLDAAILESPLVGEGVDQKAGWGELLREVADAAAGELLAKTGQNCRVEKFEEIRGESKVSRAFQLNSGERVLDDSGLRRGARAHSRQFSRTRQAADRQLRCGAVDRLSPGIRLLMDVELEASLRFGCREMPLGEILDLGPGDVVQLDRNVTDPVDLIVGDKIVARGEVVLVNGNFGLRVTEVASPRKRLESIRCLF